MPTRVETTWWRFEWGWAIENHSQARGAESGIYRSPRGSLDEKMNELAAVLREGGWEIKSTFPLVASPFSTSALENSTGVLQSAWAGGMAYAAPVVEGIVVLCQRSIEISEEEEQAERERIAEARRREAEMRRREAATPAIRAAILAIPVEPAPGAGLLSGSKFLFQGTAYNSKGDAIAARGQTAEREVAGFLQTGAQTDLMRSALGDAASAEREKRATQVEAKILDTPIEPVSSGGMFSKPRYRFDGVEYDRNEDAVSARRKKAKEAAQRIIASFADPG